jgi:regulator of protease activity HflC (stomatin/prohibitin superfamily)
MDVTTVLKGLAALAWLVFIGVVFVAVARASRRQGIKGITTVVVGVLVAALILSFLAAGLVFVQPEDRGVVISAVNSAGYRPQPLGPGLHLVIPGLEYVIRYPISKQNYTMSIAATEGQIQGDDSVTARTLDGQEIFVDASIIFSIDPAKVVDVHIAWQDRYDKDLVRPIARGIIRDAVSQYRVDEVVSTKRFDLTQQMSDTMEKKLAENGLLLIDFVLRNITFSPEYAASVEQKQIAEQQAQQAKFVVESKRQEAEQARQTAQGAADAVVIRARGDAESRLIQAEAEQKALLLIAEALKNNPDLLTYNYINKLAPGIQVMLVPNTTPYLLPLPSLDAGLVPGSTITPTTPTTP